MCFLIGLCDRPYGAWVLIQTLIRNPMASTMGYMISDRPYPQNPKTRAQSEALGYRAIAHVFLEALPQSFRRRRTNLQC